MSEQDAGIRSGAAPDPLRNEIRRISDELCKTVGGNFDFTVAVESTDEEIEKLCMLINFVLDSSRRSLAALEDRNKKLAELDELKTQFFAHVSHEIRTPLTLISAPVRSLLRGDFGHLPDEAHEMLARVARNTARLQLLINDVLDFSKFDAARQVAHREAVDIRTFVARIIEEVEPLARERGLKLYLLADSFERPGSMDPSIFERILLNLLANALKFTPSGGEVEVNLTNRRDTIVLRVTDTGVGIPTEKLDDVFKRFQQADSAPTRRFEGTGLGLALVREFVQLLGGKIDVRSKVGEGTSFSIELPFIPVYSTPTVGPIRAPASETTLLKEALSPVGVLAHAPGFDSERKTISQRSVANEDRAHVLIVEDNPDMLHYIAGLLKPEYEIATAASGVEALEILRHHRFDLILSDIMMPQLDGRQLLARVRSDSAWSGVPFIFLTAIADQEQMASGFDEGADDYIRKPFEPHELRSRIRVALRHSRLVRQLEKTTEELRGTQATLEKKVEERTVALEEQTRLARAANEAKGLFLANMSHEIRTPLGAIVGFADMLRDHQGTASERQQWIDIIHRNGEQLTKIINQVLDLSKIEAGQLLIEESWFSPRHLAIEVHELLLIKAQEKKISLRLDIARDVPDRVFSDPLKVRQVMVNLIGNAIKFTQAGEVRISVSRKLGSGNPIVVDVVDTGSGIPPEFRDRIFEAFVQGHSLLQGASLGTGLGLALSRQLARALGGDVVLNPARPGTGGDFTFTFRPRALDEKRIESPVPEANSTEPKRDDQRLSGVKILLAEDSPDNQILISRYIRGAGGTIEFASNGRDAIDKASRGNYDLVLMDIQMPEVDGCGATEELRRRGYDKPIIALTAYALKDERDRCLRSGCDDHLTKPIDRNRLIEAVIARKTSAASH